MNLLPIGQRAVELHLGCSAGRTIALVERRPA